MKILLIYIFLFYSQHSFSYQVKKENDQIYFIDNDCTEFSSIINSLAEWTSNVEKDTKCNLSLKSEDSSKCKMNITNCVPKHVRDYQDLKPSNNGPNCWNLSLVMRDILPGLRYSSPQEMAFYMQPPICRQLKNNEALKSGDIGAIRNVVNNKLQESHGFIYISDKIAYSKNGFSKFSPYSLQTLDNVYSVYGVDKSEKCRSNELTENSNCRVGVSYFRCISFAEYLASSQNTPKEITTSLQKLDLYENCGLQKFAINGKKLSPEIKRLAESSVNILLQYIEKEKNNNSTPNTEERKFILGSIQLRLSAISQQIEMTDDFEHQNKMLDLTASLTQAISSLPKE